MRIKLPKVDRFLKECYFFYEEQISYKVLTVSTTFFLNGFTLGITSRPPSAAPFPRQKKRR